MAIEPSAELRDLTVRPTFAVGMERGGAKVSTIQQRLGPSSLATTGRYLSALGSVDNTNGTALAERFGIV